jgi:hypothetical protein
MTAFFVYILPIILVMLECWFLRTCVRFENGKKVPRLLLLLLMLASFVPVLGLIESIAFIAIVAFNISFDDLEIADNRFTRFWIKD